MKEPFASLTPSVFVIGSPLQALCLVGAVRNLQLNDYRVIVIDSVRYKQVENVLNRFDIQFECRYAGRHRWRMRWYRLTSLIHRHNKYKRLFLGDYRSVTLLYFGLQYISDGADIVYLDDGSATIPLFNGSRTTLPLGGDTHYAEWLTNRRNICFMKYFYSIYIGFTSTKYIIKNNSLSILNRNSTVTGQSKFYFIGTSTEQYCKTYNIPEESLVHALHNIFVMIKDNHPQAQIVYIPHGRDNSTAIKSTCYNMNVEYKKLDIPVELFFLDVEKAHGIYGFGSSALYNLKQMYPNVEVFNVFLPPQAEGDATDIMVSISDYYERCGIKKLIMEL